MSDLAVTKLALVTIKIDGTTVDSQTEINRCLNVENSSVNS